MNTEEKSAYIRDLIRDQSGQFPFIAPYWDIAVSPEQAAAQDPAESTVTDNAEGRVENHRPFYKPYSKIIDLSIQLNNIE